MAVVEQATPKDFQQIFADYGYDLAISKTGVLELCDGAEKPGFPFLMIDTNIYTAKRRAQKPRKRPESRKKHCAWLDEYFALQQGEPADDPAVRACRC